MVDLGLRAGRVRRGLHTGRLIRVECLHWRDVKPDALFLIDRSNDEVDRDARKPLREGYQALSDRERGQHPIHRIQNDGTVEDSLVQMLALLGGLLPDARPADHADAAGTAPGSSDQLPLIPSPSRAPLNFTALSPARPTVVYETYWRFAAERQEMFFRKIEGLPAPWTTDTILARHKFTNAYRASDRVSQYPNQERVIYRGRPDSGGSFLPHHPVQAVQQDRNLGDVTGPPQGNWS